MIRSIAAVILSAVLFGCGTSTKFESDNGHVALSNNSDKTCNLTLNGSLSGQMVAQVKNAIQYADSQNCALRDVWLFSLGGNEIPAMQIGEMIRSRGLTTRAGGYCLGGCVLIYMAGANRKGQSSGGQELGFSSPSNSTGNCISPFTSNPSERALLSSMRQYVDQMLPKNAADLYWGAAMESGCGNYKRFNQDRLFEVGFTTEVTRGFGLPNHVYQGETSGTPKSNKVSPSESDDVSSKLISLKRMLSGGQITQKDYDRKKQEILKGM